MWCLVATRISNVRTLEHKNKKKPQVNLNGGKEWKALDIIR